MKKIILTACVSMAIFVLGVGDCLAENSGRYNQTNLVSDTSNPPGGTPITVDPNLVNSWGITHSPTGPWWVNNNGDSNATIYDSGGKPFAPFSTVTKVTIPPPAGGTPPSVPTGIIFNGTKDFELAIGQPARFMFVTEDGTISGWNPSFNSMNAVLKVDNSAVGAGAVYKGAAMALNNGVLNIYVANFRSGSVEVYDTNFATVPQTGGAFADSKVPDGFAPFNVLNIGGRLFVTYAKQDAAKHDDVAGKGKGFVDIFSPDGTLIMRLKHGPWFNSPWGVALAPDNFGKFSGHILVGNFGSGQIAAFNPVTGKFKGFLKDSNGHKLVIDGLWGIGFGNGNTAGPVDTLFFSAGINGEKDGLFGTLTPAGR